MGETPEGPMPSKEKRLEGKQAMLRAFGYKKYPEYEAVAELVKMIRGLGILMHARCPKCGAEGSISVVRHRSGYYYVVVRHPDKSTHAVSRDKLSVVLRELCEVKKDLEYIINQYKKYEERGIKFCEAEQ
jgi:hypothetical protein